MKCVIIFGPSAVGKATVGKELANNLGYKLFHNHMVIELVHNFFTWSDAEFWKLVGDIRNRIFEEIKASRITGVVFTYVWALDQQSDHDELMDYMKSLGVVFEDIYFVELSANQEERLERNKDERRLAEKKTVESAPYPHESRYAHGGPPLVGVSYSYCQTWKYIPPSRRM